MLGDLLRETIWSLSTNKVRSGLTVLGIIIGVGSVIAMVAIGQGSQASISEQIQSIGSNLIMIQPGAQRSGGVRSVAGSAKTITWEDVEAIKSEVQNIEAVAPSDNGQYQITAKGTNTRTQTIGTVPEYVSVRNIEIDSGNFITEYHSKVLAKVAVLGPDTRDDLFGEGVDPVGQSIKINGINFEVIGVTEAKGGSGFNNFDDTVYIPIMTSQRYLTGNDHISSVSITASDQSLMESVQEQITSLLLERHGIKNEDEADFRLMNQADIIETASNITGTLTLLLASIAGISLLVGGIGIMNMMLTTVTERTREIGLRKAVGIKKIYINLQFLAESVVLTFFGGLIGVGFGWVASFFVSHFSTLETKISISSILLAFGISAAVGIIFGFYPARKAAAMSPIDALKYE
ncbi:MAG TPA: ABC transporter permease [Candidatus Moranbacteria bacterium]|jgi:putative ABC transport system permease protein|nr:FtsX-like permease family protein [Candidatus Moranbacteria bacterium]HOF42681.1 ABC transporter permease [Candidatus Moranbacteria bacterium]HPX94297.1 ABC transporter permease [Candidatus Moranbacteria bacterium]HQB59575.1 ABC transporter permease [Candidatus Moranbacteria bacterium]